MGSLGTSELIIIFVLVLLVFGGSQLPKLAKNLGKAQKEFKEGLDENQETDGATRADASDTQS